MKKEWINPELLEEILAVTEEGLECESENGEGKCLWPHKHICKKCGRDFGHKFGSHFEWEIHQRLCNGSGNNDQTPGVTMS